MNYFLSKPFLDEFLNKILMAGALYRKQRNVFPFCDMIQYI